MPEWKTTHEGVETMTLAVMGCVVNGPGESKAANIGISLPGTGEAPNCPIFIDGQHVTTLRGTYDELAAEFQRLVDDYVEHTLRPTLIAVAARTRSTASGASPISVRCSARRCTPSSSRATASSSCPTGGGKSLCFQAPALVDRPASQTGDRRAAQRASRWSCRR